jgi:hypothetical protein
MYIDNVYCQPTAHKTGLLSHAGEQASVRREQARRLLRKLPRKFEEGTVGASRQPILNQEPSANDFADSCDRR